jgi:hypothetical protein
MSRNYEYAAKSNRLVDVRDTADASPRNITGGGMSEWEYYGGFKDKHITSDKYIYGDLNGNMTALLPTRLF